jgi:pSer/pThr/pTyr-binding forkhead associated (FHA) protein
MTAPTDPSAEVVLTIELLDSAQNVPIQTWRFPAQPEVKIGRAPENDVVITHPYVSRNHVRLLWRDGDWELVNTGTHGTIIQGRVTPRALVVDGDEIRLGPLGPTLRLKAHRTDSGVTPFGTLAGQAPAAPTIEIDAVKKAEEVAAVTDSVYFRALQARLQALRERRQ